MAPVSYPRALAMAALQAALSGTWIAAGELSPARRRLARFGTVALVSGLGYVISPPSSHSPDGPDTDESPDKPGALRLIAPGSENALGIAAPDLGSADATRAADDTGTTGDAGSPRRAGAADHAESAGHAKAASGTGSAGDGEATGSAGASGSAGTAGVGEAAGGGGASHGLLDASDLLGIGDKIAVPYDKRKAAIGAAVVVLSVGAMAGRRRLEKRWLARLTRNGHPHPTRGLAVRIAAVEFVGQLALQLVEQRRPRA